MPSATALNALYELAQSPPKQRGTPVVGAAPNTGVVLVRNDSGGDRDRFDVLGIDGPAIDPGENLSEFQSRVVLLGVTPTADHAGRFAVLLDPAPDGAIVRGVVSGVTIAQVEMVAPTHTFADAVDGEVGNLVSADSGAARILWSASTSGTQWSIVAIGGGGGGGSSTDVPIVVKVVNDGGSAGSLSATCSFTYEIYARTADVAVDDPIAYGLSPSRRRIANTKYLVAGSGTLGLAVYKPEDEEWQLLDVFREVPDRGDCSGD